MPKIVDKEEKRSKILEAAIRVFAKKGMIRTKISDIAEAANIGKGTLYEYFRSKDEVFSSSFLFFMNKVEAILSERLSRFHTPLDKLSAVFIAWADILDGEYVDYLDIVLDFWAEGIRTKDKFATVELMDYYYEFRRSIDDLLKECIADKSIKPVNTNVVASAIIGALDGLLLQWIMDRNVFDMREAVRTLGGIIVEGLKRDS
ncbi:MAG: TetR/AcrR family transcriptional regulator [Candidatus Aminicenantes bacterium]|nr:TetR/AcrR family transcriptional regulator [Candidatus Aminicenantes bacterium]